MGGCEMLGVFGVFSDGEVGGAWNVAESLPTEDVTIGFGAHLIISVIGAGEGDLGEKVGAHLAPLVDAVVELEYVIEIRAFGDIVDEGQCCSFGIADEFFGLGVVVEVFDFGVLVAVFEELDVVAFGQEKEPSALVGGGIEKGVLL